MWLGSTSDADLLAGTQYYPSRCRLAGDTELVSESTVGSLAAGHLHIGSRRASTSLQIPVQELRGMSPPVRQKGNRPARARDQASRASRPHTRPAGTKTRMISGTYSCGDSNSHRFEET